MPQKFGKEERLCSFNEINNLIKTGESFFTGSFRVVYLRSEGGGKDKILVSVPKRNFKRAVDRNLLKRRIREAYRKNRPEAARHSGPLHIMFFYTRKEILNYDSIEQQMVHILQKLH